MAPCVVTGARSVCRRPGTRHRANAGLLEKLGIAGIDAGERNAKRARGICRAPFEKNQERLQFLLNLRRNMPKAKSAEPSNVAVEPPSGTVGTLL